MDLATGKFTAPRPGIYFFLFTGVARLSDSSSVQFNSNLYLNGNLIGSSLVLERNGPVNQYNPMALQLTLKLEKGDQLWLQIEISDSSSYLYDDSRHFTQSPPFHGFHVGGGNCGVSLRFNFIGDTKHFRSNSKSEINPFNVDTKLWRKRI